MVSRCAFCKNQWEQCLHLLIDAGMSQDVLTYGQSMFCSVKSWWAGDVVGPVLTGVLTVLGPETHEPFLLFARERK